MTTGPRLISSEQRGEDVDQAPRPETLAGFAGQQAAQVPSMEFAS
jgi:hypothetical protein